MKSSRREEEGDYRHARVRDSKDENGAASSLHRSSRAGRGAVASYDSDEPEDRHPHRHHHHHQRRPKDGGDGGHRSRDTETEKDRDSSRKQPLPDDREEHRKKRKDNPAADDRKERGERAKELAPAVEERKDRAEKRKDSTVDERKERGERAKDYVMEEWKDRMEKRKEPGMDERKERGERVKEPAMEEWRDRTEKRKDNPVIDDRKERGESVKEPVMEEWKDRTEKRKELGIDDRKERAERVKEPVMEEWKDRTEKRRDSEMLERKERGERVKDEERKDRPEKRKDYEMQDRKERGEKRKDLEMQERKEREGKRKDPGIDERKEREEKRKDSEMQERKEREGGKRKDSGIEERKEREEKRKDSEMQERKEREGGKRKDSEMDDRRRKNEKWKERENEERKDTLIKVDDHTVAVKDRGEKRKWEVLDDRVASSVAESGQISKRQATDEAKQEDYRQDSKSDRPLHASVNNSSQIEVAVHGVRHNGQDQAAKTMQITGAAGLSLSTSTVLEDKKSNHSELGPSVNHKKLGTEMAAAGKSTNLSTLDALAKAKRALEMQKQLTEKLKKLPQVAKSAAQASASTAASHPSSSLGASIVGPSFPMPDATMHMDMDIATNGLFPSMPGAHGGLATIANADHLRKVQDFAVRHGLQQLPAFVGLFPEKGFEDSTMAGQGKPMKAPVLRLDAHGREIDEHGNVINQPKVADLSTLKVNINKQKKEAFQIIKPDLDTLGVNSSHFDPDMGTDIKKILRPRRATFQFVEEGKWSKEADMFRLKSQFGEAQAKEIKAKQAALAKAKAEADINPNLIEVSERFPLKEEKPKDPVPDVEWWDSVLLSSGSYDDVDEEKMDVKMEKLTIYVEHPVPIEPPAELPPPPPQPLKLTKKEQKKLRTQRRLARERDRQEMIRQGLLEAPKAKVKMSNLMKVLGSEATQDPTKLEMEIRSAAAEREQAHADRNLARKLTPAEKREKKERKLFDDPSTLETLVSVYRVNDLSHPQTRFKVDINAQENRLSGCIVVCDTMCIVVVEGGPKSIKRYGKLMLKRINWAAAIKEEEEEEGDEERSQRVNKCVLVWQGSVAKPSFGKFLIQQCRTEAAARKFLSDNGIAHYWDLAANFPEE